jgi:hypothetical protein
MTVTQLNVDAMRLFNEFFRARGVKRVSPCRRGNEGQTGACRQSEGGSKVLFHGLGHRQALLRMVPGILDSLPGGSLRSEWTQFLFRCVAISGMFAG